MTYDSPDMLDLIYPGRARKRLARACNVLIVYVLLQRAAYDRLKQIRCWYRPLTDTRKLYLIKTQHKLGDCITQFCSEAT